MNVINRGNKESKQSLPDKVKNFLVPKEDKDLIELVVENDGTSLAQYNLSSATEYQSRSVLASLKDVPSMLTDPVCSAALNCVMQTAFQTDDKNNVFHIVTASKSIESELDKFHKDIDAQKLILTIAYNILAWGQLPLQHRYNKDGVLERVIPIPDFTSVTPIVISGKTIGFMKDNEFHPSYEYTYAQTAYYKNLGGNLSNSFITLATKNTDEEEFRNEFCYANSYLGTASKAWRNIQIIEDALLLNRMDQSNYYRLICVNVGGQVYSKSAIQVLNFYRNLFKKVRRVSYDSSGMSSKGNGQEFEVVIPQSTNQSVDIKNVGGEVDVKALADLDKQYQRLFAALQIQPSQIGFSDDVASSLGDSAELIKDRRFAKVCKTISFSAFDALRNIDTLHLRSLGYNVDGSEWSYGTVSSTIQEDQEKGETLKTAIENIGAIAEKLNAIQAEYDKNYLIKNVLGGALSSYGIDVEQLLSKDDVAETDEGPTAITTSFKQQILQNDAHVMALSGIFDEKTSKAIMSAFTDEKKMSNLTWAEKFSPMTLKQLCSSVAVRNETPLDLKDMINTLDETDEDISQKFKKGKVSCGQGVDFRFPLFCSKGLELNAGDIDVGVRSIKNLYIDSNGNHFINNKADLASYISAYMNECRDLYVENVIRLEK